MSTSPLIDEDKIQSLAETLFVERDTTLSSMVSLREIAYVIAEDFPNLSQDRLGMKVLLQTLIRRKLQAIFDVPESEDLSFTAYLVLNELVKLCAENPREKV